MKLQLIGKKIGMTQIYDGNNTLVPVTVVQAGPCPVVQVKTVESDGYNAVQIAYGIQKKERLTKPVQGHFEKAGIDAPKKSNLKILINKNKMQKHNLPIKQ